MKAGTSDSPSLKVSAVVPVYRSEAILRSLCNRLLRVLQGCTAGFEIVLVEDCGGDNSWSVITDLVREDKRIRGIRMSRNYGQHNALLCGIRSAVHPVVVTLDDDLQNPPEEIPKLLAVLREGYDVAYGTPNAEQHRLLRNVASQITKLVLQGVMGAENARMVSAFRAFRTNIREAFSNYAGSFASIDILLTWGTTRFKAIGVQHDPRASGRSHYTLVKLLTHAMNLMTGFSVVPLQIASVVGFLFTTFGIGVFIYVLIRYLLQGTPVHGFTFLASIIAIFSGAQLFSLGMIGEYLARMHFRLMDMPSYTVSEEARHTEEQS
jgi:undecaprenyl-phosphate 4-deoxy-4-formamido-L-arabinose transferase